MVIDPAESRAVTQSAIAAVDEHANEAWKRDALRAIREVARTHEFLTANDVWEELADTDEYTHEPSALGPVMLQALREGTIEKTDMFMRSKIPRQHQKPLPVWRSLIYQKKVRRLRRLHRG
jgi:hypothetical protein